MLVFLFVFTYYSGTDCTYFKQLLLHKLSFVILFFIMCRFLLRLKGLSSQQGKLTAGAQLLGKLFFCVTMAYIQMLL